MLNCKSTNLKTSNKSMKNILDLNMYTEASRILLKEKSYCSIDIPNKF